MTRRRTVRIPLTHRMAALLERMAFALDALPPFLPDERAPGAALSTREAFAPSAARLAEEARALVAKLRGEG